MHELYATQAILEKALQKAVEQGASKITDLHLAVGRSQRTSTIRFSSTG